MGHRDMIWSRHQPAQLLAWGIRFFLAAALTATQTPGDYAPFALGCVAACGPGAGGIAALLGDDFDLVAVAPDGELFAGGGSERVACGE